MGSNSKTRWKLSFRLSSSSSAASPSSSASSSSAPSIVADVPVEFLCPISGNLMADPVIIPSGQTFERSCIQASLDLAFAPPDLHLTLSPTPMLIPNSALKSAIVAWCSRCSFTPPLPLPPEAAVALVRCLMPPNQQPFSSAASSAALSDGGKEEDGSDFGGDAEKGGVLLASEFAPEGKGAKDAILPSVAEEESKEPTRIATSLPCFDREREKNKSSSFSSASTPPSSSCHSSSSFSSSEIVMDGTLEGERSPRVANSPSVRTKTDALEETLVKFTYLQVAEQESAAANFRKATRESRDRRVTLCTQRLLGALRFMLISPCAAIQIDASAAIVNLSLEPMNKVPILRSGIVPALIEVLRSGPAEARYHAAGALFGLALEEDNRTALGVLGAIPPLLNLFTRSSTVDSRARHDSGMALHQLSLAAANRSRILHTPGAVHALLAVASERATEPAASSDEPGEFPAPARIAMMMIHNLAGSHEGRAALMDSGGVSALAELLRREPLEAADKEHCVAALFFMSHGSLRFRGLAKAAGVAQALANLVAEDGGGALQEMARRTLRAIRGEEGSVVAPPPPLGFAVPDRDVVESAVSDGLVSFRPLRGDLSNRSYRTDPVRSAQF